MAALGGSAWDKLDEERLTEAAQLLENPSWTARATNYIGMPIEWAVNKLPPRAHETISKATEKAIRKALVAAVSTLDRKRHGRPSIWSHRAAVTLGGAVGGFWGWPGLAIELPITTVIMLRSIADIARSEGEDLANMDSRLACLQVFALGGPRSADDSSESGYYAARIALSSALSKAVESIAERGVAEGGAPVMVLIARIAARFGVVVEEKAAAEFLPIIGATGGAAINYLFINHFQRMARGQFIVRGLERKYGQDEVKRRCRDIIMRPY